MLTFPNIAQIETLFTSMEPANLAGEPFTPSLHTEELRLEDIPPEPEDEAEVASLNGAKLGPFRFGSSCAARGISPLAYPSNTSFLCLACRARSGGNVCPGSAWANDGRRQRDYRKRLRLKKELLKIKGFLGRN